MKQITQRLRDGRIEVLELPPPTLTPDRVLVEVRNSVLSTGTERSTVLAGRQSLVGKARSRPDQARQVLEKAQRDGVRDTVRAVRSRLNTPAGIGYSAAGVVRAVGAIVTDIAPGDRVACGGSGYASHAEIDSVPGNLCVRIPPSVGFDEAAFATVGSIALHGVRQADVRLGERVAVIGLGLVGQLVGQLLRASGCVAVGVDLKAGMVEQALTIGSVDSAYERVALARSPLPADARDCDAVIIAASTSSADPVELAARLCRDRGRVVILGDVGMQIPRAPYYEKEIELRLSRSYGPGRYDRAYEERGLDYPIGYVRWTERRNMAAFLALVADRKVKARELITERVPIDDADAAYDRLLSSPQSPLGILIEYPGVAIPDAAATGSASAEHRDVRSMGQRPNTLSVGLIGAGSFAQRVLIPGLKDAGFTLVSVASKNAISARAAAERFGFERAVQADDILTDPDVGLAVIATRHASHAHLTQAALRAGKDVFVEKPPCLTFEELSELNVALESSQQTLTVGFNRRHAPLSTALRDYIAETGSPVELLYRVNARAIEPEHWLRDLDEGGGFLVGEGCHFVDFSCWLMGALPVGVTCVMRARSGEPLAAAAQFTAVLDFADGSMATILYGDGGSGSLGKEYVEAHAGGRSAVLDDFRSLTLHGARRQRRRRMSQDKGHRQQFAELRACLEGRSSAGEPFALDTMAVTLAAARSAERDTSVSLPLGVDPR